MNTRTFTGELNVFLTEYMHVGPEELQTGTPEQLMHWLSFTSSNMKGAPWTLVGKARVTVELVGPEEVIANKVDALRAEKQSVLADAQLKATELESKIQKLLAISYEAAQ